jgi:membrane associated rhomboid family serine protease
MNVEAKKIIKSFIVPAILVLTMVMVKIWEMVNNHSIASLGILPRHPDSLTGIITAPFIHGDWEHLFSNAVPLLICGASLFYFYREIAWKVLVLIYVLSGFWLWLGGRENYHIGASNVVYGLAAFLFFSGIIRRHIGLIAVSLLVVFLYGSMIWGLLPVLEKISWEGHLFGSIAGILCAIVFRKEGTQRQEYQWEADEEEEEEKTETESPPHLKIIYSYKKSKTEENESE